MRCHVADFLIPFHARKDPQFLNCWMQHEVFDLRRLRRAVPAVLAKVHVVKGKFRADLIIAQTDGIDRFKRVGGPERQEFGAPIACSGCGSPKKEDDPLQSLGFFQYGKLLVLLDRGDYCQCGL